MPAFFTRRHLRPAYRASGIGGKSPVWGNPDSDDDGSDDNRAFPARRPGGRLARFRLAMLFALTGGLLVSIVLVSAALVRHSGGDNGAGQYLSDWRPVLILPVLWLNTTLLLLSCATIEMCRRQMSREIDVIEEWLGFGNSAVRRAAPWLLFTILLGCLFLAGQSVARQEIANQGLYFTTDPWSHLLQLVTATHAIQLMLGFSALLIALLVILVMKRLEMQQIAIDCAAWCWETMTLFWLFLFILLAFAE